MYIFDLDRTVWVYLAMTNHRSERGWGGGLPYSSREVFLASNIEWLKGCALRLCLLWNSDIRIERVDSLARLPADLWGTAQGGDRPVYLA